MDVTACVWRATGGLGHHERSLVRVRKASCLSKLDERACVRACVHQRTFPAAL